MPMSAPEIQTVRDLVLRRSGIVLDIGKEYLIEVRLGTLAKSLALPSPSALFTKFTQPDGKAIERAIVDAMTTNETSFYRNINPFEAVNKSGSHSFWRSDHQSVGSTFGVRRVLPSAVQSFNKDVAVEPSDSPIPIAFQSGGYVIQVSVVED